MEMYTTGWFLARASSSHRKSLLCFVSKSLSKLPYGYTNGPVKNTFGGRLLAFSSPKKLLLRTTLLWNYSAYWRLPMFPFFWIVKRMWDIPWTSQRLKRINPQQLTVSSMFGSDIIPIWSGIEKGAGKFTTDGTFNLSAAPVPGLHQKSLTTTSGMIYFIAS